MAFGESEAVPQHPRALLGTCLHSVVADAHNGRLASGDHESRRSAARELFDRKARDLYAVAHPLVRAKFAAPERIPFYYLFRERAVLLALAARARGDIAHAAPAAFAVGAQPKWAVLVETRLTSRDGLLVGRPDYVDSAAGEIVDYKTGAGPEEDPDGLLDSEARQLRFYVHLARELGLEFDKGAVVRSDGRRVELGVSAADAADEGQRAREALRAFNAAASETFNRIAEPAPESCRYCPCIPFCESFWEKATVDWADQCGTHIEGTVSSVSRVVMQNTALITLDLAVTRGTTAPGPAVVQQLPEGWASGDGTPAPEAGDVVRVVNCRLANEAEAVTLIRPDRLTTALWTVSRAPEAGGECSPKAESIEGAQCLTI